VTTREQVCGALLQSGFERVILALLLALPVNATVAPPTTSDTHVTRSEALAIAEAYRDLEWTAIAGNISAGIVNAGDGHLIRTPAWVTVGEKLSMPYKWGGFTSIATFLSQAGAGKYTGSDYTSDVSWGDNFCVGVDCSGFVSLAWRKPTKYGTSTLPGISTALGSFDAMLPGDIINLSGSHVRLFTRKEENGTYTFIEAMGSYWRVMEQNYTAAAIATYTPRRYDQMIEIEAPKLLGAFSTAGSEITVHWQPVAASVAESIVLYLSTDGDSYTAFKTVAAARDSTTLSGLDAGKLYYLHATFDSKGRQGLYSMDYPIRRTDAATAEILIVEDDARYGVHDHARYFGEPLHANGYAFDVCNTAAVTDGLVPLSSYWAVIWFTGRAATTVDTALTAAERAAITAYLRGGGNLFISGQEIAYALDYKALDEAFLHDYLKADYAADDAGNNVALIGTAGTFLAGLTFELDEDNGLINDGGAYDARWPDVIKVFGTGDTLASYDVGGVGAVSASETFPGGSAPGRMVYFGFSFECVKSASDRNAVMGKVIGFFGTPPADTSPRITVASNHAREPGAVFTISLTAADDIDTATGLAWSVTDTDPALWTSFIIVEGDTDYLQLTAGGNEGTDTFTLSVMDSTGMTDSAVIVITLVRTAIPETPVIHYAINLAGDTRVTVRWQHDDKASYYRIFQSTDNATYDTVATVFAPEVSVTLTGLALNQRYYYRIRAYNSYDSPSASVSMTLGLRTSNETVSYLLVQDDNDRGPHAYIAKFVGALNSANRSFDGAVSSAVIDGAIDLADYRAVVWICGDDSPVALTSAERNALKSFLDGGGRLFLSGNNIGHDLNSQDPDFYERYLKCRFGHHDASRYTLRSVESGVFAGVDTFYIYTDDGGSTDGGVSGAAYQAMAPDRSSLTAVESVRGGRSALTYWNSGWVAGIDFAGGYGISEEGDGGYAETSENVAKLVHLNFAFECINNLETRVLLMKRIVAFFDSSTVAGRVDLVSRSSDSGALVRLTRSNHTDTRTALTDTGGRFRFDLIDPGDYLLAVEMAGFLSRLGTVFTLSEGADHFASFTLIAGDINNDGVIDIFDAARLKYGMTHGIGGHLDLNGDGNVDELDMQYIRANFGRRGE
jgi:hypothetical protein